MISDKLSRYCTIYSPDTSYEILRSYTINDHEVAWVQVTHHRSDADANDIVYRQVMCECDITEGVGWKIGDKGERYSLGGVEKCLKRKAVVHLRHLELRDEYMKSMPGAKMLGGIYSDDVAPIVLDLIAKVKRGEMVGSDNGAAASWGGYFYIQTLSSITGIYMGHLWEPLRKMWAKKQIALEGSIITDYRQPPPPLWEEVYRLTVDGWVATASLPGHRDMAMQWHYEVFRPDGTAAYTHIPGDPLMHEIRFGVDIEDEGTAKRQLARLLADAIKRDREKSTASDKTTAPEAEALEKGQGELGS